MDSILVTGGAGFIGANFINYFIKKYRHYFIINLDKLTAVSNLDNLEISGCESRYEFIHGDICDSKLVKPLALKLSKNSPLLSEKILGSTIVTLGNVVDKNFICFSYSSIVK